MGRMMRDGGARCPAVPSTDGVAQAGDLTESTNPRTSAAGSE